MKRKLTTDELLGYDYAKSTLAKMIAELERF